MRCPVVVSLAIAAVLAGASCRQAPAPEVIDRIEPVAVVGQRESFAIPIPVDEHVACSIAERGVGISERFGCSAGKTTVKEQLIHTE